MLVALPVAAFVSISSGMLLVRGLGGDQALERTMAPKSATTPIAIGITEQIGGITALVDVFTLVAGIIGAVLGPTLIHLLRARALRARVLANGAASPGIGPPPPIPP